MRAITILLAIVVGTSSPLSAYSSDLPNPPPSEELTAETLLQFDFEYLNVLAEDYSPDCQRRVSEFGALERKHYHKLREISHACPDMAIKATELLLAKGRPVVAGGFLGDLPRIGHAHAQYLQAECIIQDKSREDFFRKGTALSYYNRARRQGHKLAEIKYQRLAATEIIRGKKALSSWNHRQAWQILLPLAVTDHIEAQFLVGELLAEGKGVKKDQCLATHWFYHASLGGHIMAMERLGSAYNSGHGVWRDDAKAYFWLKRAGSLGNKKAEKWADVLSTPPYLHWKSGDLAEMNALLDRGPTEPPPSFRFLAIPPNAPWGKPDEFSSELFAMGIANYCNSSL